MRSTRVLDIGRFLEDISGPEAGRFNRGLDGCPPRKDHHLQIGLQFAKAAERLDAVQPGHGEIQDHRVKGLLLDGSKSQFP